MIYIFDTIFFIICGLNVGYLLFFVVAAPFYRKKSCVAKNERELKFAILVPAYKEDNVIVECVKSCLAQGYSKSLYDVVVISDKMEVQTNRTLEELGAKVLVAAYEESTKAKALNLAFGTLPNDYYDVAIVLDADNIIPQHYLEELCTAFNDNKYTVFQTHRVAKNYENNLSYLDAVSEEINNTIFRKGHSAAGLSSALIGSGMAFDYNTIKYHLGQMKAVGGFDRELEFRLFKDRVKIGYLDDLLVYDEKISSYTGFSNQRRRWMSAQIHYLKAFAVDFPKELIKGNCDFCDKLMQHLFIPRVLLIGMLVTLSVVFAIVDLELSFKWFALCVAMAFAMLLSIPRKLYTIRLLKSLFALPKTFCIMFSNLFKLKGANRRFIHTKHGN